MIFFSTLDPKLLAVNTSSIAKPFVISHGKIAHGIGQITELELENSCVTRVSGHCNFN